MSNNMQIKQKNASAESHIIVCVKLPNWNYKNGVKLKISEIEYVRNLIGNGIVRHGIVKMKDGTELNTYERLTDLTKKVACLKGWKCHFYLHPLRKTERAKFLRTAIL